eukprot:6208236-Pleurochrysis_carterae.AAC.6
MGSWLGLTHATPADLKVKTYVYVSSPLWLRYFNATQRAAAKVSHCTSFVHEELLACTGEHSRDRSGYETCTSDIWYICHMAYQLRHSIYCQREHMERVPSTGLRHTQLLAHMIRMTQSADECDGASHFDFFY